MQIFNKRRRNFLFKYVVSPTVRLYVHKNEMIMIGLDGCYLGAWHSARCEGIERKKAAHILKQWRRKHV